MARAIPASRPGDTRMNEVIAAVKREFDEMPGLTLTVGQARRLWALEPRVCTMVLARLVAAGYLCQTEGGRYVRPAAA